MVGEIIMKSEFEKLFDMSFDMLAILDLKGNFLNVNQSFKQILGWTLPDLVEKRFWDLTTSDANTDISSVAVTVSKGHPVIFAESQVKSKDGRQRQLRWTAYPDLESETIITILRTALIKDEDQDVSATASTDGS
jgi:PAS domain S-box-containing protein